VLLDESTALDVDRTLFKASNAHSVKLNYALPAAFPLPYDIRSLPHRLDPSLSLSSALSSSSSTAPEPKAGAAAATKGKGKEKAARKAHAAGSQAAVGRPEGATQAEARLLSDLFGSASSNGATKVVVGDNLMKFSLLPPAHFGLDWTQSVELSDEAGYRRVMDDLRADARLNAALGRIFPDRPQGLAAAQESEEGEAADGEARVVFLGTVASASNPVRSESCIYVDVPNYGGILLDAGGGAYQQMVRHRILHFRARSQPLTHRTRAPHTPHTHTPCRCDITAMRAPASVCRSCGASGSPTSTPTTAPAWSTSSAS
jgi:hypothetical protein